LLGKEGGNPAKRRWTGGGWGPTGKTQETRKEKRSRLCAGLFGAWVPLNQKEKGSRKPRRSKLQSRISGGFRIFSQTRSTNLKPIVCGVASAGPTERRRRRGELGNIKSYVCRIGRHTRWNEEETGREATEDDKAGFSTSTKKERQDTPENQAPPTAWGSAGRKKRAYRA